VQIPVLVSALDRPRSIEHNAYLSVYPMHWLDNQFCPSVWVFVNRSVVERLR